MPKRFRDKLWARISPDANAAPRTEHRRLQTKGDRSELDPDFRSRLTPQHGPHRVNGVVGSGKTLYIAHKALEKAAEAANRKRGGKALIPFLNRDVLVISMTHSAASKLRNDISEVARKSHPPDFKWEDYIEVCHKYEFLQRYYSEHLGGVQENYTAFCGKQQPCIKYDSILIDEYQDFEPNWGAFMARHVRDPQDGLFLLTFDPAQGYEANRLAPRFDEVVDILLPGQRVTAWRGRDHYLGTCFRVPSRVGELAIKVHVHLTRQHFEDAAGARQRGYRQ